MSTSSAMDVVKSEIACNHVRRVILFVIGCTHISGIPCDSTHFYFLLHQKVTVFSKTYCPHCTATKALFAELKVPAKIHELDVLPDGGAMQDALLELTGQRTVPNVFINGKHLGGNDKVMMNGTNVSHFLSLFLKNSCHSFASY
jgi:glutaredoxin 3